MMMIMLAMMISSCENLIHCIGTESRSLMLGVRGRFSCLFALAAPNLSGAYLIVSLDFETRMLACLGADLGDEDEGIIAFRYVNNWPSGFFIAGSSIYEANGLYVKSETDSKVPHASLLTYTNKRSGWSMLYNNAEDEGYGAVGGAATEWLMVDGNMRDRFGHKGGTYIPGALCSVFRGVALVGLSVLEGTRPCRNEKCNVFSLMDTVVGMRFG